MEGYSPETLSTLARTTLRWRALKDPESVTGGPGVVYLIRAESPMKVTFELIKQEFTRCAEEERTIREQTSLSRKPLGNVSSGRRLAVPGERGLWTVHQRSWKIWQLPLSVLRDKTVCPGTIFRWDGARGLERQEPRTWGLALTLLCWEEGSSHLL